MAKQYVSPVSGTWARKSSSPFGARRGSKNRKHAGNDLQAANGSNAVAVIGGTVQYAGHNGGYQYNAVVMGDDGYAYRYATHGRLSVKVGQRVEQGQPVGKIARRHLHFEVIPPTSPAYEAMKANPGQFVSTQWYGAGTPVTIDPASFFGVKSGAEIAMGKPIDAGTRSIVAITPNDPFGVFGFQAGRTVPLPKANPIGPLAAKVQSEIAAAITKSSAVPQGVASPVPNALTTPSDNASIAAFAQGTLTPDTPATTIAAKAAKPVGETTAKTIAENRLSPTAMTEGALEISTGATSGVQADARAALDFSAPIVDRRRAAAGVVTADRAKNAKQEETIAQRDAEVLRDTEIARVNREKKVTREAEIARQNAFDTRDLDASEGLDTLVERQRTIDTAESALRSFDARQQTIGTAEAALRRSDDRERAATISTAERALQNYDARTTGGRGVTIAASGEAGVGSGPGVADPRPATITPAVRTIASQKMQSVTRPTITSGKMQVTSKPAGTIAAAVPAKGSGPIYDNFMQDTILGATPKPAVDWRPPPIVKKPPLELTVPVQTAPNAAAANASRMLAARAAAEAGRVAASDMIGGSYGQASYGRRQADGSVTGTTSSGTAYRSTGGGQKIEVGGKTFVKNKRNAGYSRSKVLCTYYCRVKKWLPKDIWMADGREYFLRPGSKAEIMRIGYHWWAVPTVRFLERQSMAAKVLERVLWPVIKAWSYEAAYRTGHLSTGTLRGKFARLLLEPSAYVIGYIVTRRRQLQSA